MEGEYEYLKGQPEEKPQTQEEMEHKMALQVEVMKYAMHITGISAEDWAAKYSEDFRELFENSDIERRYVEAHDENPEPLYAWIQQSLDNMAVKK